MLKNRKSTIRSIVLAAISSLAGWIQIAAAKSPLDGQGLWVANGNYISEFQGSALTSSGSPDAHIASGINDYLDPISIAFDHRNNLWITDLSDLEPDLAIMEVLHVDIVSRSSGAVARRRLVIPEGVGISSEGWFGLGFDTAGNLFVSNTGQQLLKVARNRLAKNRPSPGIVISSKGSTVIPGAIRFDASNNLWVAAGNSEVWRFSPTDRAGKPPSPSLIVSLLSDFFIVGDLSFDRSGNLWLAGLALQGMGPFVDEVEMISAADLTGMGWISPSPSLTITSSAFGFDQCLGGLDFDHSGDLWVSVVGSNGVCKADAQLVEFTPSQLRIGGNLDPLITISPNSTKTNLAFPGPIRFGPAIK
jgi:hypothetical protein